MRTGNSSQTVPQSLENPLVKQSSQLASERGTEERPSWDPQFCLMQLPPAQRALRKSLAFPDFLLQIPSAPKAPISDLEIPGRPNLPINSSLSKRCLGSSPSL